MPPSDAVYAYDQAHRDPVFIVLHRVYADPLGDLTDVRELILRADRIDAIQEPAYVSGWGRERSGWGCEIHWSNGAAHVGLIRETLAEVRTTLMAAYGWEDVDTETIQPSPHG
jgi:hypothetical protein